MELLINQRKFTYIYKFIYIYICIWGKAAESITQKNHVYLVVELTQILWQTDAKA